MKKYGKLVRDKIPEIIRSHGEEPVTRILNEKEYLFELVQKLKEEVAEFEQDNSVEELADVQEVIIAIREFLGIPSEELNRVLRQKADKNGRFKKRVYLESVKNEKT